MANGIKIGNLDVSSFKVGSADCRVYLGDTCVYSGDTPTPTFDGKFKLILNDESVISAECDATSSVTSAETSAYKNSVVSAELGDCVTEIGDRAFYNFTGATSIAMSDSITSIGQQAFYGCRSLTSITIPNSVTTIAYNAFASCSGLTSIVIPSGVTSIGNAAFNGCYVTLSNFINNSDLDEEANYYWNCNIVDSDTDGIIIKDNSVIKYRGSASSVTIPDSVTSIGKTAFFHCDSFTSVTIPNSVTSIGETAFGYCTSLTSIEIPSGVTQIAKNAISYCYSLTSVTLDSTNLTTIGQNAFKDCSGLTSVTIYTITPPSLDSRAFLNTPLASGIGNIYVPAESVNTYKEEWSDYADIITAIV